MKERVCVCEFKLNILLVWVLNNGERERGNEGLKSLWIFAWKLCRTPGWACWGYVISTFSEVGACIYVYWNGYMYVYIETGYICREQVYLLSCTSMPMPRGCWKMWMFCSSCFLGGFLCVCMGVLVFSCRFLCYCFLRCVRAFVGCIVVIVIGNCG